ncbi:uncharacterized protein G2W53_001027 [Senna tora]|uniref:Uncharacterized protein n=1 Tax=Senna tora TaxID=362788 RepID=A0A834XFE9_9FABA|nr:uncharacterized protein G2W53_001027 [Senna tora]
MGSLKVETCKGKQTRQKLRGKCVPAKLKPARAGT